MRVQQMEAHLLIIIKKTQWHSSSSTLIMMSQIRHMNKILVWAELPFNKKLDQIDKKISRSKSQSLELQGNQTFCTIAQMEEIFLQ